MPIYENPKTIPLFEQQVYRINDNFIIHMMPDQTAGFHGNRLKITRGSRGFGTTAPLFYNDQVMSYDELKGISNTVNETKEWLPALIACVIINHDILLDLSDALRGNNQNLKNNMLSIVKNEMRKVFCYYSSMTENRVREKMNAITSSISYKPRSMRK